MGSTARHGYDILGDMVSTAARLEARCKAYGVLCIIGAETYNRTKDDFFYLMLDNDLIRLNQKVNTVLHLRGKMIEIDRVEAEKQINEVKKPDDKEASSGNG